MPLFNISEQKGGGNMIYPRGDDVVFVKPGRNGGTVTMRRLFMTSPADIPNLPTIDEAAPGSDVYSVTTGEVFILEAESGEWVRQ